MIKRNNNQKLYLLLFVLILLVSMPLVSAAGSKPIAGFVLDSSISPLENAGINVYVDFTLIDTTCRCKTLPTVYSGNDGSFATNLNNLFYSEDCIPLGGAYPAMNKIQGDPCSSDWSSGDSLWVSGDGSTVIPTLFGDGNTSSLGDVIAAGSGLQWVSNLVLPPGPDIANPDITLLSPPNNTILTIANVDFIYNVSDQSDIASCSLMYDDVLTQTDNDIIKDTNQSFPLTNLVDGLHNWSISCTDSEGNIGSSNIFYLNVSKIGTLQLNQLIPNVNVNVEKDDFFQYKVSVVCSGGKCGDTNVSLDPIFIDDFGIKQSITLEKEKLTLWSWFFNLLKSLFSGNLITGMVSGGLVPTTPTTPFWTNGSNPVGPSDFFCLEDMLDGDSCEIIWWVNASGEIGITGDFFAFTNSTTYPFVNDEGDHVLISITESNPPSVYDLSPISGTEFNTLTTIEISANVTDETNISEVIANIVKPDLSQDEVTLSQASGDEYSGNYLIPEMVGNYVVTIIANDSNGIINDSELTSFIGVDITPPSVFDPEPIGGSIFHASDPIDISINVTDNIEVDTILANITSLDGYTEILNLVREGITTKFSNVFNSPLYAGGYVINFIANDTFGNINSTEIITFSTNNTPPNITNLFINSTDKHNRSFGDLLTDFVYYDEDSDQNLINETRWYKDGAEVITLRNLSIVNTSFLREYEYWTYSVRTSDGINWSSWENVSINITDSTEAFLIFNSPVGIISSSTALMNFSTNENSTCYYRDNLANYSLLDVTGILDHNQNISLSLGMNVFYVKCIDLLFNEDIKRLDVIRSDEVALFSDLIEGINLSSEDGDNFIPALPSLNISLGIFGNMSDVKLGVSSFENNPVVNNTFNLDGYQVKDLEFYSIDAPVIQNFIDKITFKFFYNETKLLEQNITEEDLGLFYYDPVEEIWKTEETSFVNITANYIEVEVDHLSLFVLGESDSLPAVSFPLFDNLSPKTDINIVANSTYNNSLNFNASVFFNWFVDTVNVYNQSFTNIPLLTVLNSELGFSYFEKDNVVNASVYAIDNSGVTSPVMSNSIIVLNTAPTISTINILSDDIGNRTTGNLNGLFTTFDIDSDSIVANETKWYNNSIEVLTFRNLTQINSVDINKGESWSFSSRVYDSTDWGEWVNSSSLLILNTEPEFVHILSNLSFNIGDQIIYDINCSDIDNDVLSYSDDSVIFDINDSTGLIDYTFTSFDVGTYLVNIGCNDGEVIINNEFYLTIIDPIAPVWFNGSTSPSNKLDNHTSHQFNVSWTDNVLIDTVFVEHNFTGALANYSITGNDGIVYYYDYGQLDAGNYSWRMHANDSSGNFNITDWFSFLVNNSVSSNESNITFDVSLIQPLNDSLFNESDPMNITFNCLAFSNNYSLTNVSLFITNLNNSNFSFYNSSSIVGDNGSGSWILELNNGIYSWNCLVYNNNSDFIWADTNFSFEINDLYVPDSGDSGGSSGGSSGGRGGGSGGGGGSSGGGSSSSSENITTAEGNVSVEDSEQPTGDDDSEDVNVSVEDINETIVYQNGTESLNGSMGSTTNKTGNKTTEGSSALVGFAMGTEAKLLFSKYWFLLVLAILLSLFLWLYYYQHKRRSVEIEVQDLFSLQSGRSLVGFGPRSVEELLENRDIYLQIKVEERRLGEYNLKEYFFAEEKGGRHDKGVKVVKWGDTSKVGRPRKRILKKDPIQVFVRKKKLIHDVDDFINEIPTVTTWDKRRLIESKKKEKKTVQKRQIEIIIKPKQKPFKKK